MRELVLGASGLASGVAIYSALVHLRRLVRYRELDDLWIACVDLGAAGIVLLVGQLVFRAEALPLTLQAVLYVASLGLVSVGLIGLAWDRRHPRRPRGGTR